MKPLENTFTNNASPAGLACMGCYCTCNCFCSCNEELELTLDDSKHLVRADVKSDSTFYVRTI